ncbi:MAG: hypothetical protein WD249_11150 [Gaiellaceae bacterium]
MTKRLRRPLFAFTLGAALMAAVLLGRAAYATDGAIHACFKPSNGTLYLLGDGSDRTACQPGDIPISWSAQGLQGPQGEQGLQGEHGLQGEPGQDGQNGVSVMSRQLAAGDSNCPNGGSEFTSASGVTYACNGADGQDGQNGQDGQDGVSVTTQQLPVGNPNCPAGGVRIDSAGDPVFVCNGSFSGTTTSPNGQYRLTLDNNMIRLEGPNGRVEILGPGVNIDSALALQLGSGTSTVINGGAGLNLTGASVSLNGGSGVCASAARIGDSVAVDPVSGIGAITHGSANVCIGG